MAKAVLLEGNSYYVNADEEQKYRDYYNQIKEHLRRVGYDEVVSDPAKDYTQPPDADLWVGHSRGAGMLWKAPEGTRTLDITKYEDGYDEYKALMAKEMKRLGYKSVGDFPVEDRPRPGPEHYTLTDRAIKAIEDHAVKTSSTYAEMDSEEAKRLRKAVAKKIEYQKKFDAPENPSRIYHGSQNKIDKFEARPHYLAEDAPVVFGTPSRVLALSHLAPWRDSDFDLGTYNDDPTFHMTEQYPGAFEKIYKGRKGYLYELDPSNFEWGPQLMRSEFISKEAPEVLNSEELDVYEALLAEEAAGRLKIHRAKEKTASEQDMHVYHASPKGDIEEFEPRVTNQNSHIARLRDALIYATKDKRLALSMAAGPGLATDDRVAVGYRGEPDNLKFYIDELVPGALEDYDREAYLYTLPGQTFKGDRDSLMPEEVVSDVAVKPTSKEHIPNILKALRELEGVNINEYGTYKPLGPKVEKTASEQDFAPDFTPAQLKELGVYDQVYGDAPSEASMKEWPEHWINEQDPLGWLQWYDRYSEGRRTDDDSRQIKRWKSFKARHLAQYLKNPTPRRAAALRNWGIDVGNQEKLARYDGRKKTLREAIDSVTSSSGGSTGNRRLDGMYKGSSYLNAAKNIASKATTRATAKVKGGIDNANYFRKNYVKGLKENPEYRKNPFLFAASFPGVPGTLEATRKLMGHGDDALEILSKFATLKKAIQDKTAAKGTATKRDPKKWSAAKSRAKAKMGGKWSARAAQLAVKYYKDSGGRYSGKKPTKKNNKLKKWTKEEWGYRPGSKAEKDSKKSPSSGTKGRYLPKKKWQSLSKSEQKATDAKKRKGMKKGKGIVANTAKAKYDSKKDYTKSASLARYLPDLVGAGAGALAGASTASEGNRLRDALVWGAGGLLAGRSGALAKALPRAGKYAPDLVNFGIGAGSAALTGSNLKDSIAWGGAGVLSGRAPTLLKNTQVAKRLAKYSPDLVNFGAGAGATALSGGNAKDMAVWGASGVAAGRSGGLSRNLGRLAKAISSGAVKVARVEPSNLSSSIRSLEYPDGVSPRFQGYISQKRTKLTTPISDLPQPPPPANDSEKTRSELLVIKMHMEEGKLPESLMILADREPEKIFYIACEKFGIDPKKEQAAVIKEDFNKIAFDLKYIFKRPRPWSLSDYHGVNLNVTVPESADTPSYPSGHAMMGYGLAEFYKEHYPEYSKQWDGIADIIQHSRLQAGVHFPSDNEYSKQIVDEVSSREKVSIFFGEEAVLGGLIGGALAGEGNRALGSAVGAGVTSALGYALMPYVTAPLIKQVASPEVRKRIDAIDNDKNRSLYESIRDKGKATFDVAKGNIDPNVTAKDMAKGVAGAYARSLPITMAAAALTGLGVRYKDDIARALNLK